MAAIVLVSAKGSPGVTTVAAALTAASVASGRALLAELDPAGGSVQVLASGPASWGLLDAAGRLRRESGPDPVLANLTELPAGVHTLLAPTAGHTAESVIGSVADRWIGALRAAAPDVVIDAGRWEPSQRTAHRIAGADLVGLVCRPTVGGIEAARLALDRLRTAARAPVAVVVVGHKPYRPEEIAAHLDVPLGGTLAWDPRAVAALWLGGAAPRWRRSSLGRSAAATGAQLTELANRASARSADHPPRAEQAARPAHAAYAPPGRLPPPPLAPSAPATGTSS